MDHNLENPVKLKNFEYLFKTLPVFVQNLLAINGFDNFRAFVLIDEKDFEDIETFARNQLRELIPSDTWKDYYGVFVASPGNFTLLPGFRKQIFNAVNQLKYGKARLLPGISLSGETQEAQQADQTQSKTEENNDIEKEVEKIVYLLKTWMKNKIEHFPEDTQAIVMRTIETMPISVEIKDGSRNAAVVCTFCENNIRIRLYSMGASPRWQCSNLHKHFLKQHINKEARFKQHLDKLKLNWEQTDNQIIPKAEATMILYEDAYLDEEQSEDDEEDSQPAKRQKSDGTYYY